MAKFYGKVGFGTDVEVKPGSWSPEIQERFYYGDVNRRSYRWERREEINKNFVVDQDISIVADEFAIEHFHEIKYVIWNGVAWEVSSIDPAFPRLNLSLGGVYNGKQAGVSD